MAKLNTQEISDKVFELTKQFNHLIFENPDLLDGFPEKSVLVLLDTDDPEFNKANIELVKATPHPPGSQLVYIQMEKRVRLIEQVQWKANVMSSMPA